MPLEPLSRIVELTTDGEVPMSIRLLIAATMFAAGAATAQQASPLCIAGQAVSVLYAGQWYPAKVLKGPDAMGTCLVSYDGFGSNWDEWVKGSRMRAAAGLGRGNRAALAPAPGPSAPAGVQAVPAGKYSCYTFDNGQLNYAFTDVVIQPGGRYTVGNSAGTFFVDAGGTMTFTGTMANAKGRFAVKSSGKPQIDLVFDGDARASMACSRG